MSFNCSIVILLLNKNIKQQSWNCTCALIITVHYMDAKVQQKFLKCVLCESTGIYNTEYILNIAIILAFF